jgi:hypothetical protein
MDSLDRSIIQTIADRAIDGIGRHYPNKPGVVVLHPDDVISHEARTPAFSGCFDWHSAVHAHWSLARLLRIDDAAPWSSRARSCLADSLTQHKIEQELKHRADHPGFEMPYGVAWLAVLQAELTLDDASSELARTLSPLCVSSLEHFSSWLARLPCPIRSGEHSQSAFAMHLVLEAARCLERDELAQQIEVRARDFYLGDSDAPLSYEPSAYDFLSPSLAEAALMSSVLARGELSVWLDSFLPTPHFEAVATVDRSEGKLVHWDGLNLSRAWMMGLLHDRSSEDRGFDRLRRAHLDRGLAGLQSAHFAGAHWLGSFALLALTGLPEPPASVRR